jgi:hypothetical protein
VAGKKRSTRAGVDLQVADHYASTVFRAGATEMGADAGEQLGQPKRLRDVVVGAGIEPEHDVDLVAARGQDHDRGHWRLRPEAPTDLHPVEVGQPQIEQHEVRCGCRGELEPLGAGRRPARFVAVGVESLGKALADRGVVFDDENLTAVHSAQATSSPERASRGG